MAAISTFHARSFSTLSLIHILLRDHARLQAEAQGLRDQLKAILAESLGRSA